MTAHSSRVCLLASCSLPFTPKREWQVFCCTAHRQQSHAARYALLREEFKAWLAVEKGAKV